jgi:osmotically-inducible protein OsmY
VPKDKVLIDVADGVVTLRGELPAAGSAAALAEAAKTIDGVRAVDNLLSTAEAGANGNGEPKAKKRG